MKKTSTIIITLGALVLGAVAIFNTSDNSKVVPVDEVMIAEDEKVGAVMERKEDPEKEGSTLDSGGKYVIYSPEKLAAAAGTRRVIYFYATWCPTCQPADKDFQNNMDRLPQDVTVLRANYSDGDTDQDEKDLAKKYGVTYQHTFVQIDKNGQELVKWNGGQLDELLAKIK